MARVDGGGRRQRRHNHGVLGSWDELIDEVGRRPGMFVGRSRYALVRSFVEGFGYARDDDVLPGFQRWLGSQPQNRAIRNYSWPASCCMSCSASVTRRSGCRGETTRPQLVPAGLCLRHLRSARTTSPTPKKTHGRSPTCSHGSGSTSTPGQPLAAACRHRAGRSPLAPSSGKIVEAARPTNMSRHDRAVNEARPRWITTRRPAVRRSSSGLHDALAECPRSDIMGGGSATYCCATPFGTSVLSPRQDVVR